MDFLNSILAVPLDRLPFLLITLLIAFTVHEFAHAYFANLFGDPTAKLLGRVSLNPSRHLDGLGIILFLIAGFGWARPVPVNRDNLRNPRWNGIVISAVGPLSNIVIAFITVLIYVLMLKFNVYSHMTNDKLVEAFGLFFSYMIHYNILLFLFNLIPLPPLDGYRIIEDLAPKAIRVKLQVIEKWSMFIFLLIVFLPPIRRVTLDPLFSLILPLGNKMLEICWSIANIF